MARCLLWLWLWWGWGWGCWWWRCWWRRESESESRSGWQRWCSGRQCGVGSGQGYEVGGVSWRARAQWGHLISSSPPPPVHLHYLQRGRCLMRLILLHGTGNAGETDVLLAVHSPTVMRRDRLLVSNNPHLTHAPPLCRSPLYNHVQGPTSIQPRSEAPDLGSHGFVAKSMSH